MRISVPYAGRVSFGLALCCLLGASCADVFSQGRSRISPVPKVPAPTVDAAARPVENSRSPEQKTKPETVFKRRSANVVSPTSAESYVPDEPELTGEYKGVISYPDRRISGTAEVVIRENELVIKTGKGDGKSTIFGRIGAVTTRGYTAVALRLPRLDGSIETISLRLRRVGTKFLLKSVNEEENSFSLMLACPDYPGCLESDLCRPLCKGTVPHKK